MDEGGFGFLFALSRPIITPCAATTALVIHLPNSTFTQSSLKAIQLRLYNFPVFVHAWNMFHICIYVLDIIIMLHFSSFRDNDLHRRFFMIEPNDEENYSRICHLPLFHSQRSKKNLLCKLPGLHEALINFPGSFSLSCTISKELIEYLKSPKWLSISRCRKTLQNSFTKATQNIIIVIVCWEKIKLLQTIASPRSLLCLPINENSMEKYFAFILSRNITS